MIGHLEGSYRNKTYEDSILDNAVKITQPTVIGILEGSYPKTMTFWYTVNLTQLKIIGLFKEIVSP
jgi:hypothetical protein